MHDNVTLVAQEHRDHQMTIRIPQRIRDLIDAQADNERRSAADIVNNILEEHYSAARDSARSRRR
jgi:predicted DNA-binding protein